MPEPSAGILGHLPEPIRAAWWASAPLLTACGDPAVGSFALLALLAPVSEYGQVAIEHKGCGIAGVVKYEDIFDPKHTVRCKVIFPSRSACNCGGIRRRADASRTP